MIRGAIFDMDGLLFDTESVYQDCWHQAGREMGFDVPDEMPIAFIGCGREQLPEIIRRYKPDIDIAAYIERGIGLAHAAQLSQVPVLKPGVNEVLAKCRENGVRTAIATSSTHVAVNHNLSAAGLMEFFDAIVTGPEVAHGKPAPDIFLLAAERIGVAPAECVVFEDSLSGIHAARAAGCFPVMIPDRIQPTAAILALCLCRSSLFDALDLIGI